jgi:hypothetical protein
VRRHLPKIVAAALCVALALAVVWRLGWLTPAPPPTLTLPPHKAWHHPHAFTVPAGWVKLKAGDAFSFYAPPGTVLSAPNEETSSGRNVADLPGHNSYVGHVDAPGIALRFDYGAFDDDLSFAAAGRDVLEEALIVDGRDANIVTAQALPGDVSFAPDKPWFAGLLVARVAPRTAYYGLSDVVWNRLRFFGYAKTQAQADIVRKMFATVEFTAPMPQ